MPKAATAYTANAAAYDAEARRDRSRVKAAIASIPEDKRVIITSHDAFGYFEHAYGLTFLAPEGISTEAEASAADVAALITPGSRRQGFGDLRREHHQPAA